jgi:hypothetical protein
VSPVSQLLRYAVLGAVALSVLPATSAGLAAPCPSAQRHEEQGRVRDAAPQTFALAFEAPTNVPFFTPACAARRVSAPAAPRGMTASPSGKQLALRLGMTREEAGQLLLRQITPN